MSQQYQIPADVVVEGVLAHFGQQPQQLKCIEELAECGARIAKDITEKHVPQNSSSYDKTVEEICRLRKALENIRDEQVMSGNPIAPVTAFENALTQSMRNIAIEALDVGSGQSCEAKDE